MKMIKEYLVAISLFLLLIPFSSIAQENEITEEIETESSSSTSDINPLRLGVKAGVPNVFSINVEYVTPLLDNRVAFAVDYFPLTLSTSDVEAKFKNFEIGSNVYLKNTGKGLYGGISYFSFNADARVSDVDFDDESYGTGNTSIEFNTFNLKVGAKLGRAFYFRIELGYGFGELPETVVITSDDGNSSTTEDIEEVISFLGAGVPVFNFGIGYSFL